MNIIFDGARVLLLLSFLIYASWSDWKNREVSNKVWIVLAPLGFLLTSGQYVLFAQELLLFYALSFGVTSTLAVILFYSGAFGGADAKALICLSLTLPYYPIYIFPSLEVDYSPLFPITVISNSVLLAALTALYVLLRNLLWKLKTGKKLFEGFEKEGFGKKLVALLTGYKITIDKLQSHEYLYPLEDVTVAHNKQSNRKLYVIPKDEDREQIVKRILEAAQVGKVSKEVWVTPGLPMLIFITAGLIIALLFGDIIWFALRILLS
jgi:preflagellin peptidase FlaK